MANARETKSFDLGGGYSADIVTYITAREMREVTNAAGMKRIILKNAAGEEFEKPTLPDDFAAKQQDAFIKAAVKKIERAGSDDGARPVETITGEAVLESVLDMPRENFKRLIVAINELMPADTQPPKKCPGCGLDLTKETATDPKA